MQLVCTLYSLNSLNLTTSLPPHRCASKVNNGAQTYSRIFRQTRDNNNMEGTETENYVFAGICVPLGIFYLIFSIMNLLGEFLGSPGRRFIYEMDEVIKIFLENPEIFL